MHLPVATHKRVKKRQSIQKGKQGRHSKWVIIKNNFGLLSRWNSPTQSTNANMKTSQVDKYFFIKPRTYFCDMHGQKCACLDKWNGNLVQFELSTKSGSRETEENQSDVTTGDETYRGATNNFAPNGGKFESPLCDKSKKVGKNPVKRSSSKVNGFTKRYLPTEGTAAYNTVTNAENTGNDPLSIFKTESDKILEHIKKWKMKRSTLSKRGQVPDYVVGRDIPSPSAKEVAPNYGNILRDKKRKKKKTDTCATLPKKLENFRTGEQAHCNYANGEKKDSPKNEAHIEGKTTQGGISHTMATPYNNNKVKRCYLKKEEISFSQKGSCNFNQLDDFHIVSGLTMERKLNLPGGNCPRHKTPSDLSSCSAGDRTNPANIPRTEGLYQNEQINQRKKRKIDTQSNRNALINKTNNCKELLSGFPAIRLKGGSENDAPHSSQIFSKQVKCVYLPKGNNQDIAFEGDLKWKNYILTNKSADAKGSTQSEKHSYDIYKAKGRKSDIKGFGTPSNNLNYAKKVIKIGTSQNIQHSATKKLNSEELTIGMKNIQNERRESQNRENGNKKTLTDGKVKFELGKRNTHSLDEAAKATRRSKQKKYNDNSAITTEEERGKKTSRKVTSHMTRLGKTPESNLGKRSNHNITLRQEKGTFGDANPTKRGTPDGSNNLPKRNMLTHSNGTKESKQLRRIKQMASTCKTAGFTNKNVQAKIRGKNNQSEVNKVKPTINDTAFQPSWDGKQKLEERKDARQPPSKAIHIDANKNTKGIFNSNFTAAPIYNILCTNLKVHEGMTDFNSHTSGQSENFSHEKTSPCSSGKTEYASSVSSPGHKSSEFSIVEEGKKETRSPKRPNYKSHETLLYELIHTNDNKSRIKQFIEQSEGRQNECTNLCSQNATHRSGTTEVNTNDVNVKTNRMNSPPGKCHNEGAPNDHQDKSQKSTSNGQKEDLRKSHETLLYELINENDNRVKILNFLKRSNGREISPSQGCDTEGNYPKHNGHENDRLGEGAVKIIPHLLEAPPPLSSHSRSVKSPTTKCILPKWKTTQLCKMVENKNAPMYTIPSKYHNKYAPQKKIKAMTTKMQSTKEMKQKGSITINDKIRGGYKLTANKKGETKLSDVQSHDAPHQVSSKNPHSKGTSKGEHTQRRQIVTEKRGERNYLIFAKLKSGTTKHDIPKRPKSITIKLVHAKEKNENKKNIPSSNLIIKKQVDNRPTKSTHAGASWKVPIPSHMQIRQSKMAKQNGRITNQVNIKKCPIRQEAIPRQTEQKTKGEIPEEQKNSKEIAERTFQSDKKKSVQDGIIKIDHTKHKVNTITHTGVKKRKLLSGAEANARVKARKVQTEMIPKKINIQMMTTKLKKKIEKNDQSANNEEGQRVNSASDVKVSASKETTPSVVNPLKKVNTECIHILLEKKNRTHFTNPKEEAILRLFKKDVQKNSRNKDIQMSFSLYVSSPVVNPPMGQHLYSAFSNRMYHLLDTVHLNQVSPSDELEQKKLAKKQNSISHEGGNTYLSSAAQAFTKMKTMLTIHFYQTEGINSVRKCTTMTVQLLQFYQWSGKKANLVVMHGQTVCLNNVEEVKLMHQEKPHLANVDTATKEECKEPSTWLQAEVHSNHYAAGKVKNEDINTEIVGWENKISHSTIFITVPLVKWTIKSIIMSREEGKNAPFEESEKKIDPAKISAMHYQITTLDGDNKLTSDKVQTKKMCANVAKKGNTYVLAKKENYELGKLPSVDDEKGRMTSTCLTGTNIEDPKKDVVTIKGIIREGFAEGKGTLMIKDLKEGSQQMENGNPVQLSYENPFELKSGSPVQVSCENPFELKSGNPVQLPHTNDNKMTNQTTQPPNGDIEKEIFTIKQLIKEILTEMKNGLVKEAKTKKSKNSKKEKWRLKGVNGNAGINNLNKKGSKWKKGKDTSIEKVKEKDINVTASVSKMKLPTLEVGRIMNALEKDCVISISTEEDVQTSTREVTAVSDVSDESEVVVGAELSDADDAMMLEDVLCRNDVIVGHSVSYNSASTMLEDLHDQDNVMLMENASEHIDVVVVEDVGSENAPIMVEDVGREIFPMMVNTPSQTVPRLVDDLQGEIEVPNLVDELVCGLEDYKPSNENKMDDAPCRDAKKEEIRQEIKKLIEMVKELKREYTKEMEKEKCMITYSDETNVNAQIIDLPFDEDRTMLEDSPAGILTLQMKEEKTEKEFQHGMIKDHEEEQSYQLDVNKIATTLPEQINLKQKSKSCNDLENSKADNATTHSSRPTCTKRKNSLNERVKLKLMMRQSLKMGNSNEAKVKKRKEKEKLKQILKDILNAETIRIFLNDQAAENDLHEYQRKRSSPHVRAEREYVNAPGEAVTRAKEDTCVHSPTKSVNPLGDNPPSPSAKIPQLGQDICYKMDLHTLNDPCGEIPIHGKETAKGKRQNENSSTISERNEKIKKLMSSKRVTLNESLAMKRAFFNAQKKAGTEDITDDFFC
ncbi:Uncharacterized protein PCOAH_00010040 [Plasmodium coatneyi]|uniref:Uncharacterized protein n=1 Tax=Plasmodium coatneyi TaxID=208452 RepID=A0A1B1DV65_9APIC|nr:Uncharacterized protein PCOAH_00010040 [Plasmodium coatneyi]ANQ06668.1 Uncharacterized protein PCOAH_00010040 [Plasmodium coatneyi]